MNDINCIADSEGTWKERGKHSPRENLCDRKADLEFLDLIPNGTSSTKCVGQFLVSN